MEIFGLLVALIILFVLLGTSAELLVSNFRVIGQRLRITPFALGLVLGMLTTTPELFVGINATLRGVSPLSFGNLMGGVVVLLGFLAGLSVIANRSIGTRRLFDLNWLLLMGGVILLPMFLALDSRLSSLDGLIVAGVYLWVINRMVFHPRAHEHPVHLEEPHPKRTTKQALLYATAGVLGIVIFSRLILQAGLAVATTLHLPLFFTGAVLFSLGTNLPEITIAVTAWRRKLKRLALGNIMGSAFSNAFVVGILALLKPIELRLRPTFWVLFFVLVFLVSAYIYFGVSDNKFTRREGIVLLILYFVFLLSEVSCALFAEYSFCVR